MEKKDFFESIFQFRFKNISFKRYSYANYIITLLLISLPSQINPFNFSISNQSWTNLIHKNCFNNEKIETLTGKNRATISHKIIKAWKKGNFNFVYGKVCELAFSEFNLMRDGMLRKKLINLERVDNKNLNIAKDSQTKYKNEGINKYGSDNKYTKQSIHNGSRPNELIPKEYSKIAQRMNFARRCEIKFISPNGFGLLGKTVKQVLTQSTVKNILKHNISFGGACPGYREMNLEERKNIWVFVMMSMSHYESSCKESAVNQGPYGLASGILQLHSQKENIYTKWDPDLNCEKGASENSHQSLKCALTMIGEQIYKGVSLFNDNSHWQVLRNVDKPGSQAYHIRYAISQITNCKSNPFFIEFDMKSEIQKKLEARHPYQLNNFELALNMRVTGQSE